MNRASLLALVAACVLGSCKPVEVQQCAEQGECGAGFLCEFGRCRWPCSGDGECAGATCVRDHERGVCLFADEVTCDPGVCPEGLTCTEHQCTYRCAKSSECHVDRVCREGQCLRPIPDAGTPDAGTPDAGDTDAGSADAGALDAGSPDAGAPDAGDADDAGVADAGDESASDAGE